MLNMEMTIRCYRILTIHNNCIQEKRKDFISLSFLLLSNVCRSIKAFPRNRRINIVNRVGLQMLLDDIVPKKPVFL